MLECEVEEENLRNPAIDSRIRLNVGVVQHSFYILRIYFDDQVANIYNPESCCMQALEEAIKFQLWL